MKAASVMSRLVRLLFIFQLALLVGCNTQPAGVSPEASAVPAEHIQTPTIPSSLPPSPTSVAIPTFDLTKQAENPEAFYTPEPTTTPARSVDWLVDLLRTSQAITITSVYNPEVQVPADQATRQQLVEAARVGTISTVQGDNWHGQCSLPYPNYILVVSAPPPYQGSVSWASPRHFVFHWYTLDDSMVAADHDFTALYDQESGALWETMSRLAPAALHYPRSSIRYLLQASKLRYTWAKEGDDVTYDECNPRVVGIAQGFAQGILTTQPPPKQETGMEFYFTVENAIYEVKVWDNNFTYNGHTYQLDGILKTMQATVRAN